MYIKRGDGHVWSGSIRIHHPHIHPDPSIHPSGSIRFSKTRYIKNTNRSRLSDELASATLHVQQLRTLYNVEHLQSSDTLVLDFQSALNHVENSLKDLQEKYMDTRIVKNFEDVDTKTVRAYTGTINRVWLEYGGWMLLIPCSIW